MEIVDTRYKTSQKSISILVPVLRLMIGTYRGFSYTCTCILNLIRILNKAVWCLLNGNRNRIQVINFVSSIFLTFVSVIGAKMDMLEVFAIDDIDSLPETKWHIKQPADDDDRPNALLTGSIITHVMCVQVYMGASISMNLLFSKFKRRDCWYLVRL